MLNIVIFWELNGVLYSTQIERDIRSSFLACMRS